MALVFKRVTHSGLGTGTELAAGYFSLKVKFPLVVPVAVLRAPAAESVVEAEVALSVVAANAEPDKVKAAKKYKPLNNISTKEKTKNQRGKIKNQLLAIDFIICLL